MWTILIFYFYADNLKVSTVVSINFFLEKWFKFCVKIGFECRDTKLARFGLSRDMLNDRIGIS